MASHHQLAETDLAATLSEVTSSFERRGKVPRAEPRQSIGRYRIGEQLGAGASGTVYRAVDVDRDLPVALKVLHRFDPPRLARFKSEFRLASQCFDPCLVSVFELIEEEHVWAIAMELVDGPPLLAHVRPEGRLDQPRLRAALRDIVTGLSVLHAEGLMHRDLKPSNLLVGRDGSVRIADFGLTKLFESAIESVPEGMVIGTPAYMSPEQALGHRATPASDLYALGVFLYEALTGQLPFQGSSLAVLTEKIRREAPDPALLARDAPADLLELTSALLSRDPSRRPPLAAVVVHVCGARAAAPASQHEGNLVGRDPEIRAVLGAFDAAAKRKLALVRVCGPSGVGKSALLRHVAKKLQQERGAAVLLGRCHELESIPNKGFDAIVDALRAILSGWPPERRARDLACAVDALPMFPVLGDVLPLGFPKALSDGDRMRRAREAVVALLRAVCSAVPLVLVLDDAQWGDAEGSRLLESILSANPPCARAVVLAYRESEAGDSRLLRHLDSLSRLDSDFSETVVELRPLLPGDAQAMALHIVGGNGATAARIARESGGEPFLLEQLALASVEEGAHQAGIDALVLRRAQAQGEDAFRLVEAACVAGTPLPEVLLTDVSGVRDARRALNQLVTSSMLRRSGSGPHALVYPYHDRIRAAVESSVPPGRKQHLHRRIAEEGKATGLLTDAALTRHFEDAGDPGRAAEHALLAARAAEASLAFDSAAAMFSRFLDLSTDESAKQQTRIARARALFIAGRCGEAGAAFAFAAAQAHGKARDDLERQAVEAYLAFGHVREALALLVPLLAAAGIPYPTTPRSVLLNLARAVLDVRRRTLLRPRARRIPEQAMAARSDLAWSAKGLTNVAPAQGVAITLASASDAIRSGDSFRIARGLGFAGCGFAPGLVGGGERYLRWLREIADERDDDHLRVLHQVASGARGFVLGDWERCLRSSFEGLALAARTPAPTYWEQTIARTFICSAYEYLGDYEKMEAAAREYLRLTRGRGDRIGEVMIVSALGYPLAARHDGEALDEVIDEMRRLMAEWTVPYPFWEAFRLRLRCFRALCWNDPGRALALIDEHWPRIVEHRMLDLPLVRFPLTCVRASVLLEGAAAGLVHKATAIPEIRSSARVLERAPRGEGPTAAHIARAGIAHLEGDGRARTRHLRRAAELAGQGRMQVVERMALRALALCQGQTAQVEKLDEELRRFGVARPDAWARFVMPALGERAALNA